MADTHIKINAVTPRVQYTGNGSTTSFPYPFAIFDDTDMVVYVGDDIIETGYTVTGAGETEGGAVVFDTAPADGAKITLLRNVPIERLTDFQEGGTFRPKNINDELDRQTAFAQQIQEKVDRTLILPPTTEIDPEQILGEVERIYGSIDNVDAVADNETNVNAVAGDLANIDEVASNISTVNAVAANESNINAVNANKTNIDAVNSNKTNIDAVAGNESNINTVAVNNTNINTVAGVSGDVTTVATNISGVNTCASNISAINDAPTYAALSKQWAIGDPSEPANGSAKYWAERAHVYTEGVLHEDLISNCITEIPQDIKLELNNGTLTLKSGSVITAPDGTQVQTTQDRTQTPTGNGTYVVSPVANGSFSYILLANCVSGSTDSKAGTAYHIWYDTTNNVINYYNDTSTTPAGTRYLPLAVITISNGAVSSIDQVFNGVGYIGHHAFFLPGWKGFQANGFNEDGTLKSIPFAMNRLSIVEMNTTTPANGYKKGFQMSASGVYVINNYREVDTIAEKDSDTAKYRFQYVRENNTIYYLSNSGFETRNIVAAGFYSYDGTDVTKFDIRQPVRLATTEMIDKKQNLMGIDTSSSIARTLDTEYTATRNCWIFHNQNANSQAKFYVDDVVVYVTNWHTGYTGAKGSALIFVAKGQTWKAENGDSVTEFGTLGG